MGHGHGEDFKREAVRLARSSGLTHRQVAADLGIGLSTRGKLITMYRTGEGQTCRRQSTPSRDEL